MEDGYEYDNSEGLNRRLIEIRIPTQGVKTEEKQ
jgi:hypothetical protein